MSVSVALVTVRFPALLMAPPEVAAEPSIKSKPVKSAVTPAAIEKIPKAPLPLMVNRLVPGPVDVDRRRGVGQASVPRVRVMVWALAEHSLGIEEDVDRRRAGVGIGPGDGGSKRAGNQRVGRAS